MITEEVVTKYVAYLKQSTREGHRLLDAGPTAWAPQAGAPRAQLPTATKVPAMAAGLMDPAALARIQDIGNFHQALARERDQAASSAGLSPGQLQQLKLICNKVVHDRQRSQKRTAAGLVGLLHRRGMTVEARATLKKDISQFDEKDEKLRELTPERQEWGDAAVDAVLKHLDQLTELQDKERELDGYH